MKKAFVLIIILFTTELCFSADSVDVVFRYNASGLTSVFVAGTFNGWSTTAWPMSNVGGDLWIRNARLPVGTYLYKFYTGTSIWPNDPLNHHVNPDGYQNSIIYVNSPTIYHFLPNQRNPIVTTSYPTISAYIFPKVGTVLDTSMLALTIDGVLHTGIGTAYDFVSEQFNYTPSEPLPNGSHTVILSIGTNADTVIFSTQGGFIQLLNQFPFTTWKNAWTLNGIVSDSTILWVRLIRNSVDTFWASVTNKNFSYSAPLVEGSNTFIALADSSGLLKASTPVTLYRKVNHSPNALITFGGVVPDSGVNVRLNATNSSDPDSGQTSLLTFLWSVDTTNPSYIAGIEGSTADHLIIAKPNVPGEYHITLVVSDPDGNKDTTRNYFTLRLDGGVDYPTITSNPEWARKARVYFLFPKAFSSTGTISSAAQRLQYIKDLGFNVIWLTPVMKNAFPIDNGSGIGYNIIDFYNVASEYGTNQDLKNFISQAHALGIKVILDITPNHTSRFHPRSVDAHTYKSNSVYWNWYEHNKITSNTNGLGDCLDNDGFNYYCGFSDQLVNFNWTDIDARSEMINVYKYWIKEFGVDGYRFDVYWGPHRRYGEQYMGKPVRDALKHIKPDILLLAEDDGTGTGTEAIYADYLSGGINGGVDAAYDFKLYFNQIRYFGFTSAAITNLINEIDNNGYYPGEDALFMRFMESQDEDRIVYFYSNNFSIDATTTFKRTMAMASVLFTAPGFPMLWNGQEVGWGYGITSGRDGRTRSIINWDFQGKTMLTPHYQKLATIRGQFPTFTQHKRDSNHDGFVTNADSSDFIRVPSSNSMVCAFTRPYQNQNGLTVVNFSDSSQTTRLDLTTAYALKFSGGIQPMTYYYLNNLYDNTRLQILGSSFDSIFITLPSYESAIYTVSLTSDSVIIDHPLSASDFGRGLPQKFNLSQNYPNPFNPVTNIRFLIANSQLTILRVYDVLGREVTTLVNEVKQPGEYTVQWDATNVASGVYFYRLTTSSINKKNTTYTSIKKMLLIK